LSAFGHYLASSARHTACTPASSGKRREQLEQLPFGAKPGPAGMLTGWPEELHLIHAELDAYVASGAGLAEAGADTVEFDADG
jgi:hypothetical protein